MGEDHFGWTPSLAGVLEVVSVPLVHLRLVLVKVSAPEKTACSLFVGPSPLLLQSCGLAEKHLSF